jgi:putative addiction module component (TIGR02574 family)
MEAREIIDIAMKLKASGRFEVAEVLFQSLDKPDPEVERTWGQEALRRLRAYDQGRLATVSLDEALHEP